MSSFAVSSSPLSFRMALVTVAISLIFNPGLIKSASAEQLPDLEQCRQLWKQGSSIEPATEGWCLVIDPHKGACTACHHIVNSHLPDTMGRAGNIGPLLGDLDKAYKESKPLVELVYDIRKTSPDSAMPPYGRNGILSKDEIDLVVTFLLTY